MEQPNKRSLINRYGIGTIAMAAVCVLFFLINSIVVRDAALQQLADDKWTAYLLNALAGCEGILGEIGAMSFERVFGANEWWRLILHMYLHAGIFHLLMNLLALLFAGKVVEKKLGTLSYVLLYHTIAIINAVILCLWFPHSTSVGASAGIFGMMGVVCVMKWKKNPLATLTKGEAIYLIVFAVLSLALGLDSFLTHLVALVLGIAAGLMMMKHPKNAEM